MKKTIWGNTIVKNEGKFVYFSIMSVIDYLDKILIYDTGSTDSTVEIIKDIQKKYKSKVIFKQLGNVDELTFTKARQQMLDETKSDWLFVLDGDEVWWEDSIKQVVSNINNEANIDFIVNPYYSIIGDIYHYQEEAAGQYHLLGKKGHLNIRAINRKIPGLHVDKPYGQEGYYDGDNKPIQERQDMGIFVDAPYLHFSNIQRSDLREADEKVMQRKRKIRFEIGKKFASNFKYPEVFYKDYPKIISSPWTKRSTNFALRSLLETPLRKIKRKLLKNKDGY